MRIVGQNSDVHFGEVDEEEPDWREELESEIDPDDEELEYTPQDVIDILGFDPKEFSEPDPTQNKDSSMSLNTIRAQMILETHSLTENVGKKGRSGRKKQANFKKEIGQMKSGKRANLSKEAGTWLAKGHTNNAKKGWSNEARVKAAATRKAKKKMTFTKFKEETLKVAQKKAAALFKEADKLHDKGRDLIDASNQVWGSKSDNLYKKADRTMRQGDSALYKAESLHKRVKKILERNKPTTNAKKRAPGSGMPPKPRKGWSDIARKKAAAKRKTKSKVAGKKKSMNLSSQVAYGSIDYREATNKITKARQALDKRIKSGLVAPEERARFSTKVQGFHKNLLKKLDRQLKSGNYPPEGIVHTKKEIQSFLDDEGYSASIRTSKERQKKRPNSGKSPFGM